MKNTRNVITAMFFFVFATTKLYSQPTTEEEYNYVTKGYKIQIESGLDMKAGYTLKDFGEWSLKYPDASRGFIFKGLYRGEETKPCAVMAIYQKKVNEKKKLEYYCIPTLDAEPLWSKTLAQLDESFNSENVRQMYTAMIWALMKLSMQEIYK